MPRSWLSIFLGVLALSVALGVANNLVNPHRVPWTGRPKVLVSFDGDIPEEHWKGAIKGVKHGLQEFGDNAGACAVGAVVVAVGTALARRRGRGWEEIGEAWFRVGTAAMFAAASYYKLRNPAEFAQTVTQYKLLPDLAVRPFALWLPSLEILVAVGLLLTRCSRPLYAWMSVMWVMFIIALAQAVLRRLGITCGCFDIAGATTTGEAWFSLIRDIALLAPTLWFAARAQERHLWAVAKKPAGG